MLLVSGLPGWADDHGDTPGAATLLSESQVTYGEFVPGNIDPGGDIDFFSFVVESEHIGYLYVIETTIPPEDPLSDTYLRLVDRDGLGQIVTDDNSGEGYGSRILWSPSEAGTYYAEVSQLLPEDVGLYSISVFRAGPAPPDDHGDDTASSTLLVVNDPPLSGSMELSGDTDYFQFVAEPGYFYDIETSSLTEGSDTVIALIDSDGETELGTDDQGGREFNASRILWMAPMDVQPPENIFWVRVYQFLEGKHSVGYSVSIGSEGVPAGLPMDGSPTGGYLDNPGDVDAFIFAATENHTTEANLATLNEINNFRIRLLDTDGITLLVEQKNLEFEDLVHTHETTGHFPLLVTEPYLGEGYSISATSEAPVVNPDLNDDGCINAKDVILIMEAYHEEME